MFKYSQGTLPSLARCIDTYMSQSAAQSQSMSSDTSHQQDPELSSALTEKANGTASTAASMTSPVTPFSQSALPSKSLLSRRDTEGSTETPNMNGAPPTPYSLQPSLQKSLHTIIRRIFERCFQEGAYRQVVGIAVEARNLDVLRETITRADAESEKSSKSKTASKTGKREELMDYLLDICMNIVQERGLRNEVS